jgi:hypothetical protein
VSICNEVLPLQKYYDINRFCYFLYVAGDFEDDSEWSQHVAMKSYDYFNKNKRLCLPCVVLFVIIDNIKVCQTSISKSKFQFTSLLEGTRS